LSSESLKTLENLWSC